MQNRSLMVWILGLCLLGCLLTLFCLGAVALGYFYFKASPQAIPEPFTPLPEPTVTPTLVPATPTPTACPETMQQVLKSAQGSTYDPGSGLYDDLEGDLEEPDIIDLVSYPVIGDDLGSPSFDLVSEDLQSLQHDSDAHRLAWDFFIELVPASERRMVSKLVVFTDGPNRILAAVEQSYDSPDQWIVEIDAADLDEQDELIFTLTHEFAHLLTLNSHQVNPDREIFKHPEDQKLLERKSEACSTYFPGEGCSRASSYINRFYDRFWLPISEEWQKVDELSEKDDREEYYQGLYAFYRAHQDQFVDDYATTNPGEDIAESFTYFIFAERPTGKGITDQKLLFFYEFPELVSLRKQIREGACEVSQ